MKKVLIILALATLLVGCESEPIETQYQQENSQSCGKIVGMGEDSRGDFIEVRMSYQKEYQKDRYKVENYMDYYQVKEICNFDGLTKQPL